jgi:BirA family biotin operon repressor/biotin-[acetyl-CoA-carboxylase] ligase
MTAPGPSFDVEAFHAQRIARGVSLGAPLLAVAETGSTNDDALEAARSGASHGAVFVADSQTKGRGRRGHTWTSPPGENLTFSLLLRPAIAAERASAVALVVGLAVRAIAARRVSAPVTIKWPNDVLAAGKKLAGILVESRLSGAHVEAVVVGVGVNVHMRALPDDIRSVATSLALLGDAAPSREAVLVECLAELEPRLAAFTAAGLRDLVLELRAHDALLGAELAVNGVRGIGAGIDEDGALLLRDATGRAIRVTSGTVERL